MTDIAKLMREARYCASYCEENVWHLLGDAEATGVPCQAVIVTNSQQSVLYFEQQAAPDSYLCWDYHVFAIFADWVLDLDHRDREPLPRQHYVARCFPHHAQWPRALRPRFHEVGDFRKRLASDRRHMRKAEGWLAPPPGWPCIGDGHNLCDLLAEARREGMSLEEWA